jgi:hypothetical protein
METIGSTPEERMVHQVGERAVASILPLRELEVQGHDYVSSVSRNEHERNRQAGLRRNQPIPLTKRDSRGTVRCSHRSCVYLIRMLDGSSVKGSPAMPQK